MEAPSTEKSNSIGCCTSSSSSRLLSSWVSTAGWMVFLLGTAVVVVAVSVTLQEPSITAQQRVSSRADSLRSFIREPPF